MRGILILGIIVFLTSCNRQQRIELNKQNRLLKKNIELQQSTLDSLLKSPSLKLDSIYNSTDIDNKALQSVLKNLINESSDSIWNLFAKWQIQKQEFNRQLIGKWECIKKRSIRGFRDCPDNLKTGIIFYSNDSVKIYGGECICLPITGWVVDDNNFCDYCRKQLKNIYRTYYEISIVNQEIKDYLILGGCKMFFDIRDNMYLTLYYDSSCIYNFKRSEN